MAARQNSSRPQARSWTRALRVSSPRRGRGGAVAGGGVDQDLLSPVEQVPVRDRRIGLGQPENDGQVAEQQRSEQRRRVLQPGVVGGQDHPVVADAHPARRVGQPALEHQLGIEPIGVVPAQGERP